MAAEFMTPPQIAKLFECAVWQVRAIYDSKILPEPPRAGQARVIPVKDLPKLKKAMQKRGYLK